MKITILSLAGGQGKTTVCLVLGRLLAKQGKKILLVDVDPQATLTSLLGVNPNKVQKTLLESFINNIPPEIVEINTKLHLIPANKNLETANYYLAQSGLAVRSLRRILSNLQEKYDYIIIDPQPSRSCLVLSCLGAGDKLVITAEATLKGIAALTSTHRLIKEFEEDMPGKLVGVLPFRAHWVGRTPTKDTQSSIETMRKFLGNDNLLLPHILESNIYKKSLAQQKLPSDFGNKELEHPILKLIEVLNHE